MAWICYLLTIVLYHIPVAGNFWMLALLVGMVFHWKYWLAGIAAFLVGANWKNPLS